MTPEEIAKDIVLGRVWSKKLLIALIAKALRAAVEAERAACAHIADEFDSGTDADVGVGIIHNPRDEMARQIAVAIRARAQMLSLDDFIRQREREEKSTGPWELPPSTQTEKSK